MVEAQSNPGFVTICHVILKKKIWLRGAAKMTKSAFWISPSRERNFKLFTLYE